MLYSLLFIIYYHRYVYGITNEDKFYFLKGHIHGLGLVQRINNLLISDKVTMHLYLVFSCIFSSPYFSKF